VRRGRELIQHRVSASLDVIVASPLLPVAAVSDSLSGNQPALEHDSVVPNVVCLGDAPLKRRLRTKCAGLACPNCDQAACDPNTGYMLPQTCSELGQKEKVGSWSRPGLRYRRCAWRRAARGWLHCSDQANFPVTQAP